MRSTEAWSYRSKNTRGRSLHNFITIKRSKVISPASPTYWPTHANRHPDFLDFFLSNLPNHIHINISNLNVPASDHTPIILKIQANVPFHPFVKKRTDWNKFRNIMSTSSSLNIKLKNPTDIDTAINTLTNNIQDSFRISSTTFATKENSSRNTTPEIRELISQKRRARNTWQRTHYPIDKQRYNYFSNKLKSTLKKHKNQLYTSHIKSLSPSNGSLWRKTKALLKHKSTIPLFTIRTTTLLPLTKINQTCWLTILQIHLNLTTFPLMILTCFKLINSSHRLCPWHFQPPQLLLAKFYQLLKNSGIISHPVMISLTTKLSKTYHKKPSFFSPTSLMPYFGFLISLPLGNQH